MTIISDVWRQAASLREATPTRLRPEFSLINSLKLAKKQQSTARESDQLDLILNSTAVCCA